MDKFNKLYKKIINEKRVSSSEKQINESRVPRSARKLPNTNYKLVGFGMDINGNSIVKIYNEIKDRIFTIQINDPDMIKTHRLKDFKLNELDEENLENIAQEVQNYVQDYGTPRMKA